VADRLASAAGTSLRALGMAPTVAEACPPAIGGADLNALGVAPTVAEACPPTIEGAFNALGIAPTVAEVRGGFNLPAAVAGGTTRPIEDAETRLPSGVIIDLKAREMVLPMPPYFRRYSGE